jgi:hypothetical protein
MEIVLGEPIWQNVVLVSAERVERGGGDRGKPQDLVDRISLGRPLTVRLRSGEPSDDAELAAFLTQSPDVFHLVRVACSFRADDREPFERAWIMVSLARADGRTDAGPVAWSMAPMRTSRTVAGSRTVHVGATAMLADVSVEVERSTGAEEVFCEALGLQEPKAGWEFRRTGGVAISGTQQLTMIVCAPSGVTAHGRIDLRATVTRHRFGRTTYRGEVDGGSPAMFTLLAE